MGFWGKAQRVVLYKVRTEVEARKKEVMDKQVGGPAGCWVCRRVCALLEARLLVLQHGSRRLA